jgi:hypothetical protein
MQPATCAAHRVWRDLRLRWRLADHAQPGGVFDAVRRLASRVEGDWRSHGTAYELVRVLTAPARRGLVRLRVEGAEHFPSEGPAILVANHVSFFDSVLLMFSLPRSNAVR